MQPNRSTDAVIIGGGQAGLAMSRCLRDRGIDHVVLERGQVANAWSSERWDSLRLLTPNWLSRLPGWTYRGDDPDGFMTAAEVAAHLDRYRSSFDAPVETETEVHHVAPTGSGYVVVTNRDVWRARALVLATGACSDPYVPTLAGEIAAQLPQLAQLVPSQYRRPDRLDDRPVLVVGAAASGLQIADELAGAGREVTLAVGEHVRMPRAYRGKDIYWWLDRLGILDVRIDEVDDPARVRRTPSAGLIGTPERRNLDLITLAARGVDIRGRLAGLRGRKAQFSGSLANVCTLADLKLGRLLDQIDDQVRTWGLEGDLEPPARPLMTRLGGSSLEVDLASYGTVIWATGFRPRYPWLDPSMLDGRGRLVHDGGVLRSPGAYVLGLPFMRRRKSLFLDGVGDDARELAAHLAGHLDGAARASAA